MAFKVYVNHPTSDEYALACGKFLINFGLVELQSREWLATLENGRCPNLKKWFDKPLEARIKRVVKLLKDSEFLASSDKADALNAWEHINGKGKELRNAISHSPFVMGLSEDDLKAAPRICGFLNRKKDGSEELISIQEINGGVDTTKRLAQILFTILQKVKLESERHG